MRSILGRMVFATTASFLLNPTLLHAAPRSLSPSQPSASVNEGESLSKDLSVVEGGSPASSLSNLRLFCLTYTKDSGGSQDGCPRGVRVDNAHARLLWEPGFSEAGEYSLQMKLVDVSDSHSESLASLSVTVVNINRAPVGVVVCSPSSVKTGFDHSVSSSCSVAGGHDDDGDSLSVAEAASGRTCPVSVVFSSGEVSGSFPGDRCEIILEVRDSHGLASAGVKKRLTISSLSRSLALANVPSSSSSTAGAQVSFNASVVQAGPNKTPVPVTGQTISFSCDAEKDDVSVTCPTNALSNAGEFSWTPSDADAGRWRFNVNATVGSLQRSSRFNHIVRNSLIPPTIFIASPKANVPVTSLNAAAFAVSGGCSPAGASVQLSGAASFSLTCSSNLSFAHKFDLSAVADGPLSITALISHPTNGKSASHTRTWQKDALSPLVSISSPAANSYVNLSNQSSFALSGACNKNGRPVVLKKGSDTLSSPTCTGGAWSANLDLSSYADGSITLTADMSSDLGVAAPQAGRSFIKDAVAPTISLSTSAPNPNNLTSVAVSATLSESASDFALADISVSNGTASSFSGSGTSYSFNVAPSADGSVSISVNAARFHDAAGNDNTASNTISYIYTINVVTPVMVDAFPVGTEQTPTSWTPKVAFDIVSADSVTLYSDQAGTAISASLSVSAGRNILSANAVSSVGATGTIYVKSNAATTYTLLGSYTNKYPVSKYLSDNSSGWTLSSPDPLYFNSSPAVAASAFGSGCSAAFPCIYYAGPRMIRYKTSDGTTTDLGALGGSHNTFPYISSSHMYTFLQPDLSGNVYVGGAGLGSANGVSVSGIAKWDGSSFSNALTSGFPAGLIFGMTANPSETLYFIDGNNLYRLSGTTAVLQITPNDIHTIDIDGSGNVYGASWETATVYRWNGSSRLDVQYSGDEIEKVTVSSSGTVYTGSFSGQIRTFTSSLTGEVLIGQLGGASGVYSIDAVGSSDLYVAGDFSSVSGVSASSIARYNGSSWSALGSGISGGIVTSIESDMDNRVVATGMFSSAGGKTRFHVAEFNTIFGEWY